RQNPVKILEGLDEEGKEGQHEARNADGESDVDIAVVAGRHLRQPFRLTLEAVPQRFRKPERLEAMASPWMLGDRRERVFPDVGAAGESGVDRERAQDCLGGRA